MNAKDLWINLFDISLENYHAEDTNIQNLDMLLHVFRLEFKKISNYINGLQQKNEIQSKTIENYERELKTCNCKINVRSPLKTLTENKNILVSPKINESSLSVEQNIANNDIFNDDISEFNISKENDCSLFVDESFSTFTLTSSPTLNNRKSRSFRATTRNENLNNSSVIQGTPNLKVNKLKIKKFKQSKLPLSYSSSEKNNKNRSDTDMTFCFSGRKVENDLYKSGDDIDDIIDELNCATQTSKKSKYDSSYDCPSHTQDSMPKFAVKREAVRKKNERLQMQGWECPDCEKYYGGLNLSEGELKQRMNQCSKHRDNFNPNRLTPEGFWNPDFTPTQNSFAFEL